jgi:hypothetical protein
VEERPGEKTDVAAEVVAAGAVGREALGPFRHHHGLTGFDRQAGQLAAVLAPGQ